MLLEPGGPDMMGCLALLVLGLTSPAYGSDALLFPHCQAWKQKLVDAGAPEYSWGVSRDGFET